MFSGNLTFRFIGILSLLTILNMTFLGISWHKKVRYYTCSIDNVIDSVTKYIRHNGRRSLAQDMPDTCSNFDGETGHAFDDALKSLIKYCNLNNKREEAVVTGGNISNPVIILFTTWAPDSSKSEMHSITLRNWASLQPKVKVVVFTNSTEDGKLAKSFGGHTLPILRHGGGGTPVLKWMFLTVMELYSSSHLFGYVNSDILFTSKLTDTLETVLRTKNMTKPFVLVGRRINVENILSNETTTHLDLEKISKDRGELFGANAEDFFITHSGFPWKDIIDVVVGRLAYDNWFVGHVICKMRIDVIDLTETVLAVHQTTKKGGNFEGFKSANAHYNNALFKKLGFIPIFETGFTICAQELTGYNLCGDIEVSKRQTFWDKCKCPVKVLF